MQQFLIRHSQSQNRTAKNHAQPRKHAGSDMTTFHDLPDSLQLHILSFLEAADLCRIACVCQHWYILSCDDLLWQHLLRHDVTSWGVISHTTNPNMYKECQSDWSHKQIYLRCSPTINQFIKEQNNAFHNLSSMLRYFWPRKTPRVAMFGPGLESSTSAIVRKMVFEPSEIFMKTGAFPGSFDGIGAGFTIKLRSGLQFNLSTLYSTTKKERQNMAVEERLQHNRMFVAGQDSDEDQDSGYQLNNSVKDFCRIVDAFIFVVDSSIHNENDTSTKMTLEYCRSELFAMVNERWSSPNIPLLVLSCVPHETEKYLPVIDVVNTLQLNKLGRPWQVHHSVVSSMEGTIEAISWMLEQAQRK